VITIAAIGLLAGCAWTLGAVAFRFLRIPDALPLEALALRLIGGLGLTATLLGVLLLAGLLLVLFLASRIRRFLRRRAERRAEKRLAQAVGQRPG
jgi:hypothetical protein